MEKHYGSKGSKGDKGDRGEQGRKGEKGDSELTRSIDERIAVIETEVTYIKTSINRIELNLREITDNHLVHLHQKIEDQNIVMNKQVENVKIEVNNMKNFCAKVQEAKKYGLSGRDKAIVYGSFITAIGVVIVEIIRIFA